jgi:hypothetical protein
MSKSKIDDHGNTIWYNDSGWHRLDGPAFICGDYREWWVYNEFIIGLYDDGKLVKGEMDNIPSETKHSIAIELLKVKQ